MKNILEKFFFKCKNLKNVDKIKKRLKTLNKNVSHNFFNLSA